MSSLEVGADSGCVTGPTPKEIEELKAKGFSCTPPRHKWDTIYYSMGQWSCRIVQHVEKVTAQNDSNRLIEVEIEPDTDVNDVILSNISIVPPTEQLINDEPVPRCIAIPTAIHELYVKSQERSGALQEAS